jgi:glycerol-3-phosphate dehydrogenase subunit B
MSRVLVVGGGLAGTWAAVTAAQAGAEVVLVSRAPGATALYAGGMEIAPDLAEVMASEPFHPFTRLYRDHLQLGADLEQVCASLVAELSRAGLPISGDARHRGRYADLHGAARTAQIVPRTVAAGELGGLRGRHVAVAALEGVGDYDAASTAEALAEHGVKATVVKAPMKGLPVGAALGDLFGHPAPTVRTTADLVAYPPGFVKLPKNGFELLAAAPSPHGWRLQKALEAVLRRARVEVVVGEVTEFTRTGSRLKAALVQGGSPRAGFAEHGREGGRPPSEQSKELAADSFVLASGRFIGGGLVKSRLVHEPLLDLAVYYQGEPIESAYPRLRHLEYIDPGPAFRTGLLTDAQLRPVDGGGAAAFANLRAAGSVLGGYDYAGGGCGFGVPLLTGWLAGRLAAG